MWQGSQNICATEKESHGQKKQMTAAGYISDTKDIIKASWSKFQHDGAAAFELSEISPLAPALSARGLPGGETELLKVCQIRRIDRHPAESDKDSAPDRTFETEN
jgi:hypothetical protein